MDMHTLTYSMYGTQETLLNILWQPGWERSLGENGYRYIYMTESLCCPS